MRKLMVLLLVATMMLGIGMTAFADDTEVCELSPELADQMLVIKEAFITEKIADGTLDAETAAVMLEGLDSRTGSGTLRGLGFGAWLRDSEYADDILELLPHKNMGSRTGFATRSENCTEDGESHRGYGRGHRNNN